ncbi:hypothetical protein [Glaciecola sp. 1036]|uniref:hypothetical protein n=1 Tax=Alteromonadaceae TaxID=72275 RepID=UPI003CFF602A
MFRRNFLLFVFVIFSGISVAQEPVSSPFGDPSQPGTNLHSEILASIENGKQAQPAVNDAIASSLEETATIVDAESKSILAFDLPHAQAFFLEMIESNSLLEVIKVVTEEFPEKAVQTITLGVTLYPDYAQEVYDGAALAGVMSPEDILIAAIQAGANPANVSDATAAGPAAGPDVAVTPLGAGVGAGGTGGGDTTASTN